MNRLVSIEPLTAEYMEQIRAWRNDIPETLRTPYFLTEEMQADYYKTVICDRKSNTRYWAFVYDGDLVGMGGIENISWENSIGEISLIVNPKSRRSGYGSAIVGEILNQGFGNINLNTIWGECYLCGNIDFWNKIIAKYRAYSTLLPRRKYFNGKYWDSLYFSFTKQGRINEAD